MAEPFYIDDLMGQATAPDPIDLPLDNPLPQLDPMGNATGAPADPLITAPAIKASGFNAVPGAGEPEFSQPVVKKPQQGPTQSGDPLYIDDLMANDSVAAGTDTRRPVNFFGYDTPPELDSIMQPAMDAAIGFNDNLAGMAGLAVDDVNSILIDMAGKGFLDRPGDGKKMLQDALESTGAGAGRAHKAVDQFWNDIGSSTATGMLMMSALFAAAPMMAQAQGTSVSALLQQSLGKGLQTAPGQALRAEAGGIVGGETGQSAAKGTSLEPLAAAAGSIIGGGIAGSDRLIDAAKGAAAGALKGGATGTALGALTGSPEIGGLGGTALGGIKGSIRGLAGGPQGERLARAAVPDTSLIDADASMSTLSAMASDAVEGDIIRGNEAIKSVLGSVKGMAHPAKAAARLRSGLGKAYQVAQNNATKMWGKVDMNQEVDATALKQFSDEMAATASDYAPGNIPGDIMAEINKMPLPGATAPAAAPRPGAALFGPGNVAEPKPLKQPTLKDFTELRGRINAKLRDPSSSMTDTERMNLVKLQKHMLEDMSNANPGDDNLQQAREYSRWLHSTFDEGPVGAFLKRRSGGPDMSELGDMSNPGRAAQTMLGNPDAGRQIANASERLDMPSLTSRSEQYIRERFTEAAANSGEDAQKLLARKDIQDFQKAFPKVDAEMQSVGDDLSEAFVNKNLIEKSAFTKFAKSDPQTAIARVWGGADKIKAAREITSRVRDDPDALAAWKKGHIEELWKTTKGSPTAILARMNARDTRPMLQEVFGDKDFSRLERNISDAAKIESGGEALSSRLGRRGTSILARVIGVSVGTHMSKLFGSNSLQTSSITSSAARDMVGGFLSKLAPDKLLSEAMTNPHFERILWARQPENLKEATALTDQLKRTVSAMQAGNSAFSSMKESLGNE